MFKHRKKDSFLFNKTAEGEAGPENRNVVEPLIDKLKLDKKYTYIQKEYIITQNTSKRIINNLRADIVITNPFTDETMIYVECKDTHIDLTKETEGDKGKRLTAIKQLETQMKSDKLRSKDAIGVVFNGTTYIMAKIQDKYSEEDEEIIPEYNIYHSGNNGFNGLLNNLPTNDELIKQWLDNNISSLVRDIKKPRSLINTSYLTLLYIYKLYNPGKDLTEYINSVKILNNSIFEDKQEVVQENNKILDLLMSDEKSKQEQGIYKLSKMPIGRFKKLSGNNMNALDFFKSLSLLGSAAATKVLMELNDNLNEFEDIKGNLLLSSIKRQKNNDVFDVQDKKGQKERERLQTDNNDIILANIDDIFDKTTIIKFKITNEKLEEIINNIINDNVQEESLNVPLEGLLNISMEKSINIISLIKNSNLKISNTYIEKIEFIKNILNIPKESIKILPEVSEEQVKENPLLVKDKEKKETIIKNLLMGFKEEFKKHHDLETDNKVFNYSNFQLIENNGLIEYEILENDIYKIRYKPEGLEDYPEYITIDKSLSTTTEIFIKKDAKNNYSSREIRIVTSKKPIWLLNMNLSKIEETHFFNYLENELEITYSEEIKLFQREPITKHKSVMIKILIDYLEKYGEISHKQIINKELIENKLNDDILSAVFLESPIERTIRIKEGKLKEKNQLRYQKTQEERQERKELKEKENKIKKEEVKLLKIKEPKKKQTEEEKTALRIKKRDTANVQKIFNLFEDKDIEALSLSNITTDKNDIKSSIGNLFLELKKEVTLVLHKQKELLSKYPEKHSEILEACKKSYYSYKFIKEELFKYLSNFNEIKIEGISSLLSNMVIDLGVEKKILNDVIKKIEISQNKEKDDKKKLLQVHLLKEEQEATNYFDEYNKNKGKYGSKRNFQIEFEAATVKIKDKIKEFIINKIINSYGYDKFINNLNGDFSDILYRFEILLDVINGGVDYIKDFKIKEKDLYNAIEHREYNVILSNIDATNLFIEIKKKETPEVLTEYDEYEKSFSDENSDEIISLWEFIDNWLKKKMLKENPQILENSFFKQNEFNLDIFESYISDFILTKNISEIKEQVNKKISYKKIASTINGDNKTGIHSLVTEYDIAFFDGCDYSMDKNNFKYLKKSVGSEYLYILEKSLCLINDENFVADENNILDIDDKREFIDFFYRIHTKITFAKYRDAAPKIAILYLEYKSFKKSYNSSNKQLLSYSEKYDLFSFWSKKVSKEAINKKNLGIELPKKR